MTFSPSLITPPPQYFAYEKLLKSKCSYKIFKKDNRMMNKYRKTQYPIENVYNSYIIKKDFSYTFNNNDN